MHIIQLNLGTIRNIISILYSIQNKKAQIRARIQITEPPAVIHILW